MDTQIIAHAQELLKELGSSGPLVALTLEQRGFGGRPGECDMCPVAHYLEHYLHCYVRVDPEQVEVFDVRAKQGYVDFDTPAPVADFVRDFDLQRYPALIDYSLPTPFARR
jgi:hypothetical protein